MTQHYELLYIIPGSVTDEELPAVKTKISDLVKTAGAQNMQQQDFGRKKLAYRIGQHYQGAYQLVDFDAEQESVSAIHNQLTLAQEVLRFLLIQRDVEAEATIKARAKLRESIQAKRQEKMAKEVGKAMVKAQEAKDQVAKKEKAAPVVADQKAVAQEVDKLMSDDVKV